MRWRNCHWRAWFEGERNILEIICFCWVKVGLVVVNARQIGWHHSRLENWYRPLELGGQLNLSFRRPSPVTFLSEVTAAIVATSKLVIFILLVFFFLLLKWWILVTKYFNDLLWFKILILSEVTAAIIPSHFVCVFFLLLLLKWYILFS
jgi:hypothetical protein